MTGCGDGSGSSSPCVAFYVGGDDRCPFDVLGCDRSPGGSGTRRRRDRRRAGRRGHLFTTIWIPGALKAVRLGWWRFQRCPVGGHWSLVAPVREADLTEDERRVARENRDVRIP